MVQLAVLTFLIMTSLLILQGVRGNPPIDLGMFGFFSVAFLVVALIVMFVGEKGGEAVRSVAGATGNDIPRTLATSTTARNIGLVLILLWQPEGDLYWWAGATEPVGDPFTPIALVMLFYLLSLLVAARQAVQWAKKDEAEAKQDSPAGEGVEGAGDLDAAATGTD